MSLSSFVCFAEAQFRLALRLGLPKFSLFHLPAKRPRVVRLLDVIILWVLMASESPSTAQGSLTCICTASDKPGLVDSLTAGVGRAHMYQLSQTIFYGARCILKSILYDYIQPTFCQDCAVDRWGQHSGSSIDDLPNGVFKNRCPGHT